MMKFGSVPSNRIRVLGRGAVRGDGRFVLYWMGAFRRTAWNFALDRALDWAAKLQRPLLIVETFRAGVRWASVRHYRYVSEGMADNAARCRDAGVAYYPFVSCDAASELELLRTLSDDAAVVIADDYPVREHIRLLGELTAAVAVPVEAVDSNGLMPIRLAGQAFDTAHAFRRFLHRRLPDHLPDMPCSRPLARTAIPPFEQLPAAIELRWPPVGVATTGRKNRLELDDKVGPVERRGGSSAGHERLRGFAGRGLARYADDRNRPEIEGTSGLSADLHFGHLSAHEVFRAVADAEGWSPARLSEKPTGRREQWWGMGPSAEAFLDELVTWRELCFNGCVYREDYDAFDSLPDWAKKTLAAHRGDPRPYCYTLGQLERAETHDELWNAAQRELLRAGKIHNYLRMLWGKKILEWSDTPQTALDAMIELNNKYALDGQDPNSYGGIFWVLGRYDRPWGPVRPIFGTVRYMSSENTARKVPVKQYLRQYGPETA
jgi:deoxyribodipyrimidine photo-lyase